jgi:hypothetical protein
MASKSQGKGGSPSQKKPASGGAAKEETPQAAAGGSSGGGGGSTLVQNGDDIGSGGVADSVLKVAGGIGVVALVASLGLGVSADDHLEQFSFSYLTAFMFVLALGLGCLFWVTLQHLVNARWSVVVRRLGELFASTMPLLALLSLPILVPMFMGNHSLYAWTDHAKVEANHVLHAKAPYLNLGFFGARVLFYFVFWAALARFWLSKSLEQDAGAKPDLIKRLQGVAAPTMIVFALTITFAAVDFLMSLDAMWFSTIFGVYYFAGAFLSANCLLALTVMWLQGKGKLVKSVSVHHLHDLGKMMFGFTVFWSYIAFSQFMLIWYANVPEETAWYKVRLEGDWKIVATLLLVGHFVIPFLGLISKHVKRHRAGLAFWAIWLLVMEYVDLYFLVQPTRLARAMEHGAHGSAGAAGAAHGAHGAHGGLPFHLLDVTCLVALVALFLAGAAFNARGKKLLPASDPRLEKSLAFTNI